MRHLDLFSGIGGFALAARAMNWTTIGFCEIDPFARKILAKHWPGVPIHDDIRTLDATGLDCEIITGGFPCQDISLAGTGAGIEGARSGLWSEQCRIIGEVRPRFAVMENVAALLNRGLERVLRDLAEIGYATEWHCIPASAIGAPHRRDRIWIIAYPDSMPEPDRAEHASKAGRLADPNSDRHVSGPVKDARRLRPVSQHRSGDACENVSDAMQSGPLYRDDGLCDRRQYVTRQVLRDCRAWRQWATEPDVGRVADGVPGRVDRLKGLGNAIVPQVAELIFRSLK